MRSKAKVIQYFLECNLSLNGELKKSLMLTNTEKEHLITVSGGGSCKLTFMLVGGGGDRVANFLPICTACTRRGQNLWHVLDGLFGGGAGSGRVTYKSKMEVSPGTVLTARVGGKRQQTNLTFSAGDPCPSIERDCIKLSRGRGKKVYVMAGGDTRGVNGGWGYSGGGGDGMAVYTEFKKLRPKSRYIRGAPGGSNGEAAPNTARRGNRGGGSGKDISSYTFNTWTLTPGAGGKPYSRYDPLPKCPFSQCRNNPNQSYGGGGGGVLVNGAGPKATKHQGQGYGGGGSGANRDIPGYNWRYGYPGVDVGGLPGVILLEIETY